MSQELTGFASRDGVSCNEQDLNQNFSFFFLELSVVVTLSRCHVVLSRFRSFYGNTRIADRPFISLKLRSCLAPVTSASVDLLRECRAQLLCVEVAHNMGKLDVSCMRHLSKNDYRVLTAVEMGMKNHDLVPTDVIVNIARLRHGGAQKYISTLHRFKLLFHEQKGYDGYRLTYQGYDVLALHTFLQRGLVSIESTCLFLGIAFMLSLQ